MAKRISLILTLLIPALVYISFSMKGLGYIDAGELAAVSVLLGNAHPTGYPVFAILGHLFSIIPIAPRVIDRLNMMAAFEILGSIFVLWQILHIIQVPSPYKPSSALKPIKESRARLHTLLPLEVEWIIFCASLMYAFSLTILKNSLELEVHSLQALLFMAALFCMLKATPPENQLHSERWFLLFMLMYGLLFGNHGTCIVTLPGFIYWQWKNRRNRKNVLIYPGVVFFLLGISTYIYLPIRSDRNPVLNWGDPDSLIFFIRHITGKQFRVWFFESADQFYVHLSGFIMDLPSRTGLSIFFGIIGCLLAPANQKLLLKFLLVIAIANILYVSNYNIHDIEDYYLIFFAILPLLAFFGIKAIAERIKNSRGRRFFLAASFASAFVTLAIHYRSIAHSACDGPETYTRQILFLADPNALIMSRQWDYFVSPSLYLQYVEHVRPDLRIIDRELLRRSWYFDQLRGTWPELIEKSAVPTERYLKELAKFENNEPYDPSAIQASFEAVIHSFLANHLGSKCITPELTDMPGSLQGLKLAPRSFLLVDADSGGSDRLNPGDFAPAECLAEDSLRQESSTLLDLYQVSCKQYRKYLTATKMKQEGERWIEAGNKLEKSLQGRR